jgi:hypothetical protein
MDHAGRAKIMLESVATSLGAEPEDVTPRLVEYAVGHFAEVESLARKDERAMLERLTAKAQQTADEALRLNQAALRVQRENQAELRRQKQALAKRGIFLEDEASGDD